MPLVSLLMVRLFVIFHDIAHSSVYQSSWLTRFVGRLTGAFVVTPFSFWKRGHDHHHKNSNNLAKSQLSQTSPFTVEQYISSSPMKKLAYRLFYSGLSRFTITPIMLFIIHHFAGSLIEILLAFGHFYGLWITGLLGKFLIAEYIAAVIGVLLFSLQHTFDGVYKRRGSEWDYFENGMLGSSFFQVPWFLKFFTYGIEYHHIHHLNSRVPGHKLKQCHDEAPKGMFDCVPRTYTSDIFKFNSYELFDEANDRFVSIASLSKKQE